ncbi:hypothetical protein HPP92_012109 [Vanilla planifolia]|uniref:Calmodulin-binding domain-containing protein n=1 Tax=Vanilla planifolia TaxID=51239 RepID=A0A835QWY2_VANPL|nr:hypothetical protein HPP92_012109 [Vanilla planifolia]
MVQRKASNKATSPTEGKQSHGGLERRLSSDLLKKMKKGNFIGVSDLGVLGKVFEDIEFKKAGSSTPIRNYMKPTSSSDARKTNKLQAAAISPVSSPRRPSRAQSGQPKEKSSVSVNRATCSSTLKDFRFPAALELMPGANEAEGNSKMRVCPYTYCSLNGHSFQPFPPLKCFISARRKLLRTKSGPKIEGLSLFKTCGLEKRRKKSEDESEEDVGKTTPDFSLVDHVQPDEASLGMNKPRAEDGEAMETEWEYEAGLFPDSTEGSDHCYDQFSVDEPNGFLAPEEAETESEIEEGDTHGIDKEESHTTSNDNDTPNPQQEPTKGLDSAEQTTEKAKPITKWNYTRKTTFDDTPPTKEFNPRPPHFLPLEPDPEAETVDLRHQTVDERKSAEEWMVDYALQRAVTKLCSAQKRRVALLVQAFENVIPLSVCEEPIGHGPPAFACPRSIQACS